MPIRQELEMDDLAAETRVIVRIENGDETDIYWLAEVVGPGKKEDTVSILLDYPDESKTKGEKRTKCTVALEDVMGIAGSKTHEDVMEWDDAKNFLKKKKPAGKPTEKEDDDVTENSDDDDKPKPPRKAPPSDEDEDNGPDLTQVPKLKKPKVGDRVVCHYYDKKEFGGDWKGTISGELTPNKNKVMYYPIDWDHGGKNGEGYVLPEHIIGKATEKLFKKKISKEKLLLHLVNADGEPIEKPADNPFNNGARFDALEAQIAELKEMLQKIVKATAPKK